MTPANMIRLLRPVSIALAALVATAGTGPAQARTINLSKHSRGCLSTSIAPSEKIRGTTACIAHNSCSRKVFATFDAYPFHARKTETPVHARVSHWVGAGDSEVFGWTTANPTPAPECRVLETHF